MGAFYLTGIAVAPEPVMTIFTLGQQVGGAGTVRVTERAISRVCHCCRTIACWFRRSRQRRALREIAESDGECLLKDIGVSRQDALREASKRFWRP
jgi:uncharacterized protein YjiS (DUF1127 family)